jgi:ribosome biogenesis GTPase
MTYDLSSLGWDEEFAAAYAPVDRSDAAPARVLRADLGVCTVAGAGGVGRASLAGSVLLGAARTRDTLPCAGDWVVVRRWPDRRSTIELVLPRRTVLIGPPVDCAARGPVLAANMDVAAVVGRLSADPDLAAIERLLGIARRSGARPMIVLTGVQTGPERRAAARRVATAFPGVPVRHGPDAVRELVAPGRTLALLGGAGSGRSALVDALAGATVLPRPHRRDSAPGRDSARPVRDSARPVLVPVPGGGVVLDVPGGTGDEVSFRPAVPAVAGAVARTACPGPGPLATVVGGHQRRRRPRR